jgi:phage-related protein
LVELVVNCDQFKELWFLVFLPSFLDITIMLYSELKIFFYQTQSGNRPVEEFILHLSKEDQALFRSHKDGIERDGFRYPYVVFKHMEGKLWEIKFKGLDGNYRIAYVVVSRARMFWLHAFKKKTQKTPANDLDLAVKRMKEVLRDE